MKKFLGYIAVLFMIFGTTSARAQEHQYKLACIGFYNLENLFDTINDPNKWDEQFLPNGSYHWTSERYWHKIHNMAYVISRIGEDEVKTGPIILGVAEVENRRVLEDLVKDPQIADRHYQIIHFEGPDRRGIDVALLYQPRYFRPISARPVHVELPDHHPTRDILVVTGILDRSDTITVIVNHWPSRRGGEKRSEPLRDTAAAVAYRVVDSILKINPNAKIIAMGDLNDDPDNESVVKYMHAKGKIKELKPGDLYNPMAKKYKKGIGTLAYGDTWNLFDNLMVSQALLGNDYSSYKFFKAKIYNKPFLVTKSGRFEGYPFRTYAGGQFLGGYSDHFPVYLLLIKEINNH